MEAGNLPKPRLHLSKDYAATTKKRETDITLGCVKQSTAWQTHEISVLSVCKTLAEILSLWN